MKIDLAAVWCSSVFAVPLEVVEAYFCFALQDARSRLTVEQYTQVEDVHYLNFVVCPQLYGKSLPSIWMWNIALCTRKGPEKSFRL